MKVCLHGQYIRLFQRKHRHVNGLNRSLRIITALRRRLEISGLPGRPLQHGIAQQANPHLAMAKADAPIGIHLRKSSR